MSRKNRNNPFPVLAGILLAAGLLALSLPRFGQSFSLLDQRFSSRQIAGWIACVPEDRDSGAFGEKLLPAPSEPEPPEESLPPEETEEPEQPQPVSSWRGVGALEGAALIDSPDLFQGPSNGRDDERGQSIELRVLDPEEEKLIFVSRFLGPAGIYQYYWVRVIGDEETGISSFEPIPKENEQGYVVYEPLAVDKDKAYKLAIREEVKPEHMGLYAFVALDLRSGSAYVSPIVELYDRSENLPPPEETAPVHVYLWKSAEDVDGIPLYYAPAWFDGPRKGTNDERGQGIVLCKLPEGEEALIFSARFRGEPGSIRYYWVRVTDEEDKLITWLEPVREEDGFVLHKPTGLDGNNSFRLAIRDEVRSDQMGWYAFVAVDMQNKIAYVSQIIELYEKEAPES